MTSSTGHFMPGTCPCQPPHRLSAAIQDQYRGILPGQQPRHTGDRVIGRDRVVVTATKGDGERNQTRFAEFFVEALASVEADRARTASIPVRQRAASSG